MLTISRQTDYACRILLHLASQPEGERVTAAGIAERRLIPPALIRRIVTDLNVAGLIKTSRGSAGGIALGRPASQISLLDVVQAMEGAIALNPCTIAAPGDPDRCPFIPVCPVHEAWTAARQSLIRQLGQTTFDQLAARGHALSADPKPVAQAVFENTCGQAGLAAHAGAAGQFSNTTEIRVSGLNAIQDL